MAAQARGWSINLIVVKDCTWEKEIQGWFPGAEIVDVDKCEPWKISGAEIDVWYSDVDPPRKLNIWVSRASYIISSRRARNLASGWVENTVKLSHAECGGVTTGVWPFFLYRRLSSESFAKPTLVAGRDLSSVLNTKLEGLPCAKPAVTSDLRREAILIRPNTYHGGGLLPWGASRAYVVAPCIFAVNTWVRRRLSGQEMLRSLDVPDQLEAELSSAQVKAVCVDPTLIPMKVLLTIVDLIPFATPVANSQDDKRCRLATASELLVDKEMPLEVLEVPIVGALVASGAAKPAVDRNANATKSDDAEVPLELWNDHIVPDRDPVKISALDVIRKFALRWWNRNLERGFLEWFRAKYSVSIEPFVYCTPASKSNKLATRDWVAGMDCLRRGRRSSWWEWSAGSRPFFWRWPHEYLSTIRDGMPIWERDTLPRWTVPQRAAPDPDMNEAMTKKLHNARGKGYIIPGTVKSLTSLFSVKKGNDDIRLVYDGTKSGLNKALWAPWFPLPTIEAHLRAVEPGSFMGDIDIGEMFLNFMLHERIQPYAGIDLTPFFPEELCQSPNGRRFLWEHWGRCGMGFCFSPYQTVQGVLFADEHIRGDPQDPSNILGWDYIDLNLPGSDSYAPSQSWVTKRRASGRLAGDFLIYVDDVRTTGNEQSETRGISRRVASHLNWLGLQDAPRKRRDASQTPGAWAGSIVSTLDGTVSLTVSQERWNKAKGMLTWLRQHLTAGPTVPFKPLESHRGFLIYLVRTYPAINPYLKGVHLTLDSWRPWRRDDGWKMTLAEIRAVLSDLDLDGIAGSGEKAPAQVKWVPRLLEDLEALEFLFATPTPPLRPMRPSVHAVAVYQFGDASGSGFGSSLFINGSIYYRHGQWNEDFSGESSNFRELANLIHAIEDASHKGLLHEAELFVFTDNSAAEGAFYKGTSPSRKLFELVLRLRKLQMTGGLLVHVIHVAGKRMIAQGTDGLSRGITTVGVMSGMGFRSFVPLHLSVLERQDGSAIQDWVNSWAGEVQWQTPLDWFSSSSARGTYVWTPPPAAADVCLDQLGKFIHMRPYTSVHIVIIPRLMTSRWRKILGKICDLVFTVPLGTNVWHYSQFEPLVVGIAFPLSRHAPWRLRGTPMLESVEGALRGVPPVTPGWGGRILRELFISAGTLETMSSSMVRDLLFASG